MKFDSGVEVGEKKMKKNNLKYFSREQNKVLF